MMDGGYIFSDASDIDRIGKAVKAVESGSGVPPNFGDGDYADGGAQRFVIGKTDAAIAKSASGTVSVYAGTTAGSESDTGDNITAYNRYGDIGSGKWVECRSYAGNWMINAAEC